MGYKYALIIYAFGLLGQKQIYIQQTLWKSNHNIYIYINAITSNVDIKNVKQQKHFVFMQWLTFGL